MANSIVWGGLWYEGIEHVIAVADGVRTAVYDDDDDDDDVDGPGCASFSWYPPRLHFAAAIMQEVFSRSMRFSSSLVSERWDQSGFDWETAARAKSDLWLKGSTCQWLNVCVCFRLRMATVSAAGPRSHPLVAPSTRLHTAPPSNVGKWQVLERVGNSHQSSQ